jgi:hypothetical protein
MDKLHDLQHRTVTVEGEETVRELRSAGDNPFRINAFHYLMRILL